MNVLTRAALAALFLSPSLVVAQAPDAAAQPRTGQAPHSPEEAFRRADTNSDGKVTFEEMRARRPNITQQAFERMDQNGDGALTPADRPEGQRGARGDREPDDDARGQMLAKLMQSDTNSDGKVSYDEITTAKPGFAKADFDRLDRDSDGFISKADAPKMERNADDRPRPPRAPDGARSLTDAQRAEFRERLRAADSNADGKVTFGEAQAAFPQMTQERFNQLDRNRDGGIGPEDRPQGAGQRKAP